MVATLTVFFFFFIIIFFFSSLVNILDFPFTKIYHTLLVSTLNTFKENYLCPYCNYSLPIKIHQKKSYSSLFSENEWRAGCVRGNGAGRLLNIQANESRALFFLSGTLISLSCQFYLWLLFTFILFLLFSYFIVL